MLVNNYSFISTLETLTGEGRVLLLRLFALQKGALWRVAAVVITKACAAQSRLLAVLSLVSAVGPRDLVGVRSR